MLKPLSHFRTPRRVFWHLVFPLLLFPIILFAVNRSFGGPSGSTPGKKFRLAVFTETEAPRLLSYLQEQPRLLVRTDLAPEDFQELVRLDSIDAGLIVPEGYAEAVKDESETTLRLLYDTSRDTPLDDLFEERRKQIVRERLDSLGGGARVLEVFEVKRTNVAEGNGWLPKTVGTIVAALLVLMTLLGTLLPLAPWRTQFLLGVTTAGCTLFGLLLGYWLIPGLSGLITNELDAFLSPVPLLLTLAGLSALAWLLARICGFRGRILPILQFVVSFIFWIAFLLVLVAFVLSSTGEGLLDALPASSILHGIRDFFYGEISWLNWGVWIVLVPVVIGFLLRPYHPPMSEGSTPEVSK